MPLASASLDPELHGALMNFGQLTLSQRAHADAARAFERARALRPGSYDAAVGLGVVLRGLSQPDDAEEAYRAALALDEGRPEAWFDLAVLYQEHRDGSVEQLQRAENFLQRFVERARGRDRFAETVQEVTRWCSRRGRSPGRGARCEPGRCR